MPKHYVVILEGNPTTGKLRVEGEEILVFSNRGKENRKVNWQIENIYGDNDPRSVKYFRIVGPAPHPFEDNPPTNFRNNLELKVNKGEPERQWKYNIEWKSFVAPDVHSHDPKISVNPSLITGFVAHKTKTVKYVFVLIALLGLGLMAQKSGRFKK